MKRGWSGRDHPLSCFSLARAKLYFDRAGTSLLPPRLLLGALGVGARPVGPGGVLVGNDLGGTRGAADDEGATRGAAWSAAAAVARARMTSDSALTSEAMP